MKSGVRCYLAGTVVLLALALQEAAPAAGERQQHDRAGEIATDPTLHTRENEGSFFNEASMLTVWEFVKDKDSLPARESNQAPCKSTAYCAGLIPKISPIAATAAR